jgi:hypothetical protein
MVINYTEEVKEFIKWLEEPCYDHQQYNQTYPYSHRLCKECMDRIREKASLEIHFFNQ